MRSIVQVAFWCFCASGSMAFADAPRLENGSLIVEVSEKDASLSVTDKRTGQTWRQVELPRAEFSGKEGLPSHFEIDKTARALKWSGSLPGIRKGPPDSWQAADFDFELALAAEQPDLRLTFVPKVQGEWWEVFVPRGFALSSEDAQLVFPHCEGALLPLRRDRPGFIPLPKDNIYSGYSTYCACLGLLRLNRGDGLLMSFENPEAALYEMVDVTVEGVPVSLPRFSWRASKFHFDRPLAVTFTFSDRGGYGALAKHYQRHFQRRGYYRTLQQKQAENPAVERLIGGGVYWIAGPAEDVLAVARMMHEDGIDRAVIEIAAPYWHCPSRYEPELRQMEAVVPEIRKLGYIVSHYDQFRDAFAPDDKASSYVQMNCEMYPDQIVRQHDGPMRPGWPPGFVINPRASVELAAKRIPEDLKRFPFNGRFLDCVGTCAFWEGEDWDARHPLDVYGTRQAREELLHNACRAGLLIGTEGGIDSYLPNLHWLETPMSLVRWTAGSLPLPGWQPVTLKADYQINITPTYRIPFYSLVHHAEVVSTWRWEDGFNRVPQYWQDKNLWSVLYGNVPMFFLERTHYERDRKAIAQTHQYVCTWAAKVAYAEMTAHRFVTPDRLVQESLFSNGMGVVVNFGPRDYKLADGQDIPGRSYRTFVEGKQRAYSQPPVVEMSYDDASSL